MPQPKPKHAARQLTPLVRDCEQFLGECCERVQVAGSYRRGVDQVGDLEFVVIPKLRPDSDLFGNPAGKLVDETRAALEEKVPQRQRIKWGPRYRQFVFDPKWPKVKIDLWYAYPQAWGLTLAIRTGPSQFSQRLVTPRQRGGFMPSYYKVLAGRLWREVENQPAGERGTDWMRIDGKLHVIEPVYEEEQLCELYEMPYIHVQQRSELAE